MTLLGGIGTWSEPVFGAALVTTLGNYFATSELPVTLVTGIIFMVCVLVFRRGMIGELYASRLGRSWSGAPRTDFLSRRTRAGRAARRTAG